MLISSQLNIIQIAKPLEEFLSVTNHILILPLKGNEDVASPKGEWQNRSFCGARSSPTLQAGES